jgi:nucleoside-diphosphate-sugar epimerase
LAPLVVLVTGSSGFIGSSLATLFLSRGHTVYGLDIQCPTIASSRFHHISVDIVSEQFNSHLCANLPDFDAVVHLAATTDLDGTTLDYYKANIDGVVNILKLCTLKLNKQNGILIHASTQLVNAIGSKRTSYSDCFPDTYYGLSKVIGERIVLSWPNPSYKTLVVRPTTIWGPGMSSHYRSFLRYLTQRRYINFGRNLQKSFGYIDNICEQLYSSVVYRPTSQLDRSILYLCDLQPIKIHTWAIDLARALNSPNPLWLPLFVGYTLAFGNLLLSTLFPILPNPITKLTLRRLNNIQTSYLYSPDMLLSLPLDVRPSQLPYSECITNTAKWYRELE